MSNPLRSRYHLCGRPPPPLRTSRTASGDNVSKICITRRRERIPHPVMGLASWKIATTRTYLPPQKPETSPLLRANSYLPTPAPVPAAGWRLQGMFTLRQLRYIQTLVKKLHDGLSAVTAGPRIQLRSETPAKYTHHSVFFRPFITLTLAASKKHTRVAMPPRWLPPRPPLSQT